MMVAVIASLTMLAIVAFVIGFVCGKDAGRHEQRRVDHNLLLEYASQTLRHPQWRLMSAAEALKRVSKAMLGPSESL